MTMVIGPYLFNKKMYKIKHLIKKYLLPIYRINIVFSM